MNLVLSLLVESLSVRMSSGRRDLISFAEESNPISKSPLVLPLNVIEFELETGEIKTSSFVADTLIHGENIVWRMKWYLVCTLGAAFPHADGSRVCPRLFVPWRR
jgi:hypothetical protein